MSGGLIEDWSTASGRGAVSQRHHPGCTPQYDDDSVDFIDVTGVKTLTGPTSVRQKRGLPGLAPPPHVIPHPESLVPQAAYKEALLPGHGGRWDSFRDRLKPFKARALVGLHKFVHTVPAQKKFMSECVDV